LLGGAVGCTEYSVGATAPPGGRYNPPDLGAEVHVDRVTQLALPQVDILWIVDNSQTMQEEQDRLLGSFDSFIRYFADSGLDFHVGVISTDMDNPDESGKLVLDDSGGGRFIDTSYDLDGAVRSFSERAALGTAGSSDERGRDAAYAALVTERDTTNGGFYRDDAALVMIAISDERDYSRMSVQDFGDWAISRKRGLGSVSFNAIVGLSDSDCPEAERGTGYLELVEQVGGTAASICAADWTVILDQLGVAAAGLDAEFFLSRVPVEATLEVSVESGGTETPYVLDRDYGYDRARNSIAFYALYPPPLSVVSIAYQVRSGAGDPGSE
jgi:hypothetical protein